MIIEVMLHTSDIHAPGSDDTPIPTTTTVVATTSHSRTNDLTMSKALSRAIK